jgi:hypothetical protein
LVVFSSSCSLGNDGDRACDVGDAAVVVAVGVAMVDDDDDTFVMVFVSVSVGSMMIGVTVPLDG